MTDSAYGINSELVNRASQLNLSRLENQLKEALQFSTNGLLARDARARRHAYFLVHQTIVAALMDMNGYDIEDHLHPVEVPND
jgi:hypothetical protein